MTAIRSLSESLLDGLERGDLSREMQREILAIIVQENQRLSRLINQILDLSKIEAGAMSWELEPLDLGEIVAQAVSANRALFDDKGIALSTAADAGPVPVVADRDKIVQVVTNLLSNAAKFTSSGGRVKVRTARENGHAVVEVEDSGGGSPPDQLEAGLGKLRQRGDPRTAKPQGTGLGLPISREIVERHGGMLTATGEPGWGSCFRVALPLASVGTAEWRSEPGNAASDDADRTPLPGTTPDTRRDVRIV